MLNRKIKKLQ